MTVAPLAGAAAEGEDGAETSAGAPAPDFSLPDLSGAKVRLSELVAQGPVVMAFWATWCRPCALEIPHLSAMQDELGPRGLTVIGVSLDDATTVSDVRAFVRRHVRYTVVLDTEGRVAAQYNPEHALPMSVVIGRRGRVRHVHRGYVPGDEVQLRAEVLALLDEPVPGEGRVDQGGVAWSANTQTLMERDVRSERSAGFVRSRVDATWRAMSAGVRYDAEGVRRPSTLGSGDHNPCLRGRVGHSYVEYAGDDVRARAGDAHVVFGRGLLLHLSQVGAFGVETSVLGAEAEGTSGPVSGRVFGGVTHFSETPQTLQGRCSEIYNPLAGARLESRAGPLTLGVHGVHTRREAGALDDDGFQRLDADADAFGLSGGGVTVEVVGDEAGPHLYAEAVGVRSEGAAERETGRGLYAALTAPMGPLTVTLEAKRYERLELTYVKNEVERRFTAFMPYNVPPTLQPSDLVFKTQPDLIDTLGARVRVDAQVDEEVAVSGSLFQATEAGDVRIAHPIVGVEYEVDGLRAGLEGGWRTEDRPHESAFSGAWGHAGGEASVVVSGAHSVDFIAQWKSFRPDQGDLDPKTDLQLVAAYAHPVFEGAVVLQERKTPTPEAEPGFHASATVTWRFSSSGAVTAFAGSDPGGLSCTSGVCRILPAFEGGRLEASLRF